MSTEHDEGSLWGTVVDDMGGKEHILGPTMKSKIVQDPNYLPLMLSRYKFMAKMGAKDRKVLELGCGEGYGTPILSEMSALFTGAEKNSEALAFAQENFSSPRHKFSDLEGLQEAQYETLVTLRAPGYFGGLRAFLDLSNSLLVSKGLCLLGVDPKDPDFTQVDDVRIQFEKYFSPVMVLSMSGELLHTSSGAADYYIYMGVKK